MSGAGQDPRELAAAYSLGALDPDETRAFEAALAGSPELQREVAEYREVSALLAQAAPGAGLPAELRARVLAQAAASKQAHLPPRAPRLLWLALAASVVALGATSLLWYSTRQGLVERDRAIAVLRDSLAAREELLAFREAEINAILDPNVTLTLMGEADSPKPTIQLFWNRKTNRMLVHAFQLAPAASRRAYQLWFIPKQGAPIPSITFNTEPSGHGLVPEVQVPAGMELAAAAITEEPEGGSPQPTTPVLLVASFAPAGS
ncbi:MAG: anti-sigma factor [Gemmatimonadota bacterium]|nr:anti-sigma factor [Gemmatimonadota bacterium]